MTTNLRSIDYDVSKQQALLRSIWVTVKSSKVSITDDFVNITAKFVLMTHPNIPFEFVIQGHEEYMEFLDYDREDMINWIRKWTYVGGKNYYKPPKSEK